MQQAYSHLHALVTTARISDHDDDLALGTAFLGVNLFLGEGLGEERLDTLGL